MKTYCRRLRELETRNALPRNELTNSAIPLRVVQLPPDDEQRFLDTAAARDLRRDTVNNPIGYLMHLITGIGKGERHKAHDVVNRCMPASEPKQHVQP